LSEKFKRDDSGKKIDKNNNCNLIVKNHFF